MDHGQLKVFKKKIIIEEDSSDKHNLHLIYLLTQSSCHKSNESNIQNQGKKRMNEFIWIIIGK